MKKYLSIVAATAFTLSFTACEDVPAPYELPSNNTPAVNTDVLIDETFASSLGSFTNQTTDGAGGWVIDFSTAKASGYDNKTKVTTAGTYYLVSSEVDLTDVTAANITFDYILRYNKGAENQQLLITDNYNAADAAANWTLLNQTWTEGSDWTTFYPYALNIPAEWMGKKVRIAFKYSTNATSGSTWEVKNFKLQKGEATTTPETPGTETPETPGTETPAPTGTNLLTNGGFETWASGAAEGWAGPGNTATLSQNTTVFRSGASAINVAGDANSNKRLASKAITLKPGAYTLHFYARGSVANTSVRPGYVPVVDGAAVSSKYTYGDYANNLPTDSWQAVSHNFTLTEQTTIAIIFMNPKNAAAGTLILDDVTLTTSNGGLVEGTTETPGTETPETPPTDAIYSKALTDNADGWTFQNVTKPEAVANVWVQDATYGLKATAYVGGKRYATEAWAISPAIKLTSNNVLNFEHVQRYAGNAVQELTLWVREGQGAWQQLTITHSPGTNWTYVPSGDISLAAYAGKTIQLGFKYTSTETAAATWEFKNVVVK